MNNSPLQQQILNYAKKIILETFEYEELKRKNSFHYIDKKYFDGKANRSSDVAIQFCREFGLDYEELKDEVNKKETNNERRK